MPPANEPEPAANRLTQPGRLLPLLEDCMAARLDPGRHQRSGWSSAPHLVGDLERRCGVQAPRAVIERALLDMCRHRRAQMMLDDAGTVWYRLVERSETGD